MGAHVAGSEAWARALLERRIEAFAARRLPPLLRIVPRRLLDLDTGELRAQGRMAVDLPSRTVWLAHERSIAPTGPGSSAIDVFALSNRPDGPPNRRFIRKVIEKPEPGEETLVWLREALFYLDLAPAIACPGLVFPEFYGCRLRQHGIVAVMEFLDGHSHEEQPFRLMLDKARLVGRLGALTHCGGQYKAQWLHPATPVLSLGTLAALEELAEASIEGAAERARIVSAIEASIGDPDLTARLRQDAYPCLAHGDLHRRNYFPLAGGVEALAVIDWGKACRGAIGGDAAILLLPRYFNAASKNLEPEFAANVQHVQAEIEAGARAVEPDLAPRRLRIGLDMALIVQFAVLAGGRRNSVLSEGLGGEAGKRKRKRMASVLRYLAAASERLARERNANG